MKLKNKVKILVLIEIIFLVGGIYCYEFKNQIINSNFKLANQKNPNLKNSGYWDLTGNPIFIDDSDPNYNWSKTTIENAWCSGSGSWADPYVIENVTLDGQGSSNCIEIRNSDAYFIIRNCSLYNSSSSTKAGIKLDNVDSGKIIKNNCSDDNSLGTYLYYSNNNTLSGNTANNNGYGIYLFFSNNNTLSGNTANNNYNGIYLEGSNSSNLSGNTASHNNNYGICLEVSNNNTLSGNTANNNYNGIFLSPGNNNLIYNNILINNRVNAKDDGINNQWDNGTVGNYWDDYGGKDQDDDGIGDTPYLISGTAGAQDSFPIWNDGIEEFLGFNPFIIDDTGGGNYTWAQAALNIWCYGFGTYENPYIIEKIIINGRNSSSCLIIRNSKVHFVISNCTFYNSSNGIYDAGIKLEYVNNGKLININCSSNNGNGILLYNCQNIIIEENSVNYNSLSGISLINSDNNFILDNKNTISYNGICGIYLLMSNNNNITRNTIYNNQFGLFFNESSYNFVSKNSFKGNQKDISEINCTGNIFDTQEDDFIFVLIIIIALIISIIVFTIVGGVLVWKKKIFFKDEVQEEEKEDLKKNKMVNKLQKKLVKVDYLIESNKIELALKSLSKVEDIAKHSVLNDIINKVNEKINYCNKLELKKVKEPIIEKEIKPLKELQPKLIDRTIPPILNRSLITEPSDTKEEIVEIKEVISEPGDKIGKSLELEKDKILKDDTVLLEADTSKQKEKKISEIVTAEKAKKSIFLSYSTLDSKHFQIRKIVKELKKYEGISEVLYWEADSGQDIVEYMEETLGKTNVFVLFCSENAAKSNSVTDEWHAAFQMRKKKKMKIIPVYEDEDLIPNLLMPLLNVKYTKDDFDGFIQKLYDEILR